MRTEERKYKWCILIQEKSISLQQTSRVLPMKEINRLKLRIVFRDNGFADDTAKINVQQLLKQLSPETEMKVI
jgi:hypothetical protein